MSGRTLNGFSPSLGVGTASRARLASGSVLFVEMAIKAMLDLVAKCSPLTVQIWGDLRVWCVNVADVLTPHIAPHSGFVCVVDKRAVNLGPFGLVPDDLSLAICGTPAEKQKKGHSSHEGGILVPRIGLYKYAK